MKITSHCRIGYKILPPDLVPVPVLLQVVCSTELVPFDKFGSMDIDLNQVC